MITSTPLKSIRLYEQVASAVREQVVNGQFEPGARLPTERELAAAYGVSRNVVREAVRALVKQGLVEVRQGSGTFVTNGTTRAFGESFSLALAVGGAAGNLSRLIEIRSIIEPPIAGLAAARATPQDIEMLQRELDIMETAFDDVEKFISADHRFHLAIARATQNELIAMVLEPIVDVLFEQRSRLFYVEKSAAKAQAFHHELIDCIARGDSAAATQAMVGHMRQVSDDIASLDGRLKQGSSARHGLSS